VVALGRRSPVCLPGLPLLGGSALTSIRRVAGILYYSRYFQLHGPVTTSLGTMADLPQGSVLVTLVLPFADNGTVGITLQKCRHGIVSCAGSDEKRPIIMAARRAADPMLQSFVDPEVPTRSSRTSNGRPAKFVAQRYAPGGQPVSLWGCPRGRCLRQPRRPLLRLAFLCRLYIVALRALLRHPSEPAAMTADYFAATLPERLTAGLYAGYCRQQ